MSHYNVYTCLFNAFMALAFKVEIKVTITYPLSDARRKSFMKVLGNLAERMEYFYPQSFAFIEEYWKVYE